MRGAVPFRAKPPTRARRTCAPPSGAVRSGAVPARRSRSGKAGRRTVGCGESGAFTLSYVIIVPVFMAGLMLIAQAAAWYLASETALAAARQGANVARVPQGSLVAGTRTAVAFAHSAAPGYLLTPRASAAGSTSSVVQITVTGKAPSLVPGVALGIHETVRMPVERFVALRYSPRGEAVRRAGRVPWRSGGWSR